MNPLQALLKVGLETDALLRGKASTDVGVLCRCLLTGLAGAMVYGAAMGTFGFTPERWPQIVYSSLKVPLLSAVSLTIVLPAVYLFYAVTGLGADFRQAFTELLQAQAVQGIVLASLTPFILFLYSSVTDYITAVVCNVLLFCIAGLAGLSRLKSGFAPLIARDARHRQMVRSWLLLSAFVGVQSTWMLRPFIGAPNLPPVFVRTGDWSNAYENFWHLLWAYLS